MFCLSGDSGSQLSLFLVSECDGCACEAAAAARPTTGSFDSSQIFRLHQHNQEHMTYWQCSSNIKYHKKCGESDLPRNFAISVSSLILQTNNFFLSKTLQSFNKALKKTKPWKKQSPEKNKVYDFLNFLCQISVQTNERIGIPKFLQKMLC